MSEFYYTWHIWGSSFERVFYGDDRLLCRWSAVLPFTYTTPLYETFDNAVLGALKASTAEDDSYDIYVVCKVLSVDDDEFDEDWVVYEEPSPTFAITRGSILSRGSQAIDALLNGLFWIPKEAI